AAKLGDAAVVARTTGVSLGKAKAAVDTGNSLKSADEVREAFRSGELLGPSLRDRHGGERLARLIDRAIEGGPRGVLPGAQGEAEQHRGLAQRQHHARRPAAIWTSSA
ncbi:MAG: hypothetical protein ACR2I4_10745, partial [Actinomycetota bacterium]